MATFVECAHRFGESLLRRAGNRAAGAFTRYRLPDGYVEIDAEPALMTFFDKHLDHLRMSEDEYSGERWRFALLVDPAFWNLETRAVDFNWTTCPDHEDADQLMTVGQRRIRASRTTRSLAVSDSACRRIVVIAPDVQSAFLEGCRALRELASSRMVALGYERIRAGAISCGTGGILFAGPAGAGKTTSILTCLSVMAGDSSFVSDDMTYLSLVDERITAHSWPSAIGIGDQTLHALGLRHLTTPEPRTRDAEASLTQCDSTPVGALRDAKTWLTPRELSELLHVAVLPRTRCAIVILPRFGSPLERTSIRAVTDAAERCAALEGISAATAKVHPTTLFDDGEPARDSRKSLLENAALYRLTIGTNLRETLTGICVATSLGVEWSPENITGHCGVYGVLRKNDSILMVRKARGPYTGRLDIPGGAALPGETRDQTLAREWNEETGLTPQRVSEWRRHGWRNPFDTEGKWANFWHLAFVCDVNANDADPKHRDTDETEEALWIDKPLSRDDLTPVARFALSDSLNVSG